MPGVHGRAVLITGASSGIGAELARQLVRRGARVGLLARRRERLVGLAEEIGEAGGVAAWAEADVQDGAGLAAALERVAGELDGADVVVANAGYGLPEPPHRHEPGRALDIYDVNLLGMVRTLEWALPRFLAAGAGHLVGVASIASYMGLVNMASYCGSKAAMRIHLQSLRLTLAPRGIAVTTICPGYVRTELTEKNRFKMPFLWDVERAARKIADAIERRRREVVFPWQMHLQFALLRRLPTPWAEAALRAMAPKPKARGAGAGG